MSTPDLSLVSMDDLMIEVDKRFDAWIFSGMQMRKDNDVFTIRKWRGSSAICAGLASQVQIAVFDKNVENEQMDEQEFFEE